MMSNSYIEGATQSIKKLLGNPDQGVIVIGADINIYELAGESVLALKLQGFL